MMDLKQKIPASMDLNTLLLKGVIASLKKEDQDEINRDADFLRGWIKEKEDIRSIVLGLVGAELTD